jgi:hypothetical protein
MKKMHNLAVVLAVLIASVSSHAGMVFDANVDASLKKQMLEDISFMSSIRSTRTTPLHQKVFGSVDGQSYLSWLNSRVFTVGRNGCGNGNAVACVIPTYANKIWITNNYIRFSHPQIARLSVVYHEARHTEAMNGNWGHATCPTPFRNASGQDVRSIWTNAMLQGEPACDVTPFGSYGTQTILLKNIAKNCTNCTQKVRADAELYANDQLIRIVDPASKAAMKKDFGMR